MLAKLSEPLSRWAAFSETRWTTDPDDPSRGWFGTGYNHWGVHTNLRYASAMATLSGHEPNVDLARRHSQRALAALRFTLDAHVSGPGTCTDGTSWGQTWISALALERMFFGLPYLESHLTDADHESLQRVLVSEAEWLTDKYYRKNHHGVHADPWHESGANAPESNIWNGALLWRTAQYWPDHPRAGEFKEKACEFLVNGVSVPDDETLETLLDGKPIKERYRGAGFFPNYALDHHGYLNVGYMIICVSNAALLHFDAQHGGWPVPESLYHHQQDLWRVARRMIFADGRLARIGGDSRVRYCYCQEYLIPSLLLAADKFQDPHAGTLLNGFLDLIQQEQQTSGDESFYGQRLSELRDGSPYYYCRLESDRAAALGMGLAYLPLVEDLRAGETADFEESVAGVWSEPEHGAYFHRSSRRLASISWRAHNLVQGFCLPPDDGHLAEWEGNLSGRIAVYGAQAEKISGSRRLLHQTGATFEGGWVSMGAWQEACQLRVPDGWAGKDAVISQLAIAALPDQRTVVGLHHARSADYWIYLEEIGGALLNLPNDCLNQYRRVLYHGSDQELLLQSPPKQTESIRLNSPWVNAENRLGAVILYGGASWHVSRSTRRRGGKFHSLFVEELLIDHRTDTHAVAPGSVVMDCGWAMLSSSNAAETRKFQETKEKSGWSFSKEGVRAVKLTGADGSHYLFAANFSPEERQLPREKIAELNPTELGEFEEDRAGLDAWVLPGETARLYRCGT